MTEFLDFSKIRRLGREQHEVSSRFPQWMIEAFDRKVDGRRISRQDITNVWLAERLERVA